MALALAAQLGTVAPPSGELHPGMVLLLWPSPQGLCLSPPLPPAALSSPLTLSSVTGTVCTGMGLQAASGCPGAASGNSPARLACALSSVRSKSVLRTYTWGRGGQARGPQSESEVGSRGKPKAWESKYQGRFECLSFSVGSWGQGSEDNGRKSDSEV